MTVFSKSFYGFLLVALASVPHVIAQNNTVFSVTYIEVRTDAIETTVELLRAMELESQNVAGNLRFQTMQRMGRLNQFAILAAWNNSRTLERHETATYTNDFRVALEPLLLSPYDQRPSTPLFDTSAAAGEGEIYVVTHVDLIPTFLEEGLALMEDFVTASRSDEGVAEVGVMVQDSRGNHLTLFEVWESQEQQTEHLEAVHSIAFRDGLHGYSGSLYDERIYRRL